MRGDVLVRLCVGVNPNIKAGKAKLQQGLASCVLIPSDYHGGVQFVSGHSQDSWRKLRNSQKSLVHLIWVPATSLIDPGMQRQYAVVCQIF